ncbi:MAG: DUF2262 domain-containing protein [Firmicutes bacterium]|nr:DUF2262 domain-containing protein [[Eubacterium] siraeum]MCM1487322.1 DUF2262 domain-containing protein [Bacillota bacterium]
MDNSKKFEEVFAAEEREMIFLTGETIGFMWCVARDFWQQGAVYLGRSDPADGKTVAEVGHIFFQCESGDIDPLTRYRVKCRELKDKTPPADMPSLSMNDFLITEILEKNAADPRLEEMLRKYRDESVYEDRDFGSFYLDRSVKMYIGSVGMFGHKCELALEYDEEDSSAVSEALRHFKEIYKNKEQWDKKLRTYAAKEIESKYGAKLKLGAEEISERIKPARVYAYSYGGFNVEFDDDGLLRGNEIDVEMDENGNPASIEIYEQ